MALDAKALTMLGEMRSDLKWLIAETSDTKATFHEYHNRITAVELAVARMPTEKAEGVSWPSIIQIALGIVPLLAWLAGKLPLKEALALAHSTGG